MAIFKEAYVEAINFRQIENSEAELKKGLFL